MTISKRVRQGNRRVRALSAAIAALGALSGGVNAFQFDTGNPDLDVRWDNNFKYNAMMRVEDQSSDLLKGRNTGDVPGYSPLLGGLTDDTNLAFDQWDVVSNRFDILSELEVVWKRNFGFRVSGAGWYDFAYGDESSHPGYNKTLFQWYPASDPRNGRYADTWGLISGGATQSRRGAPGSWCAAAQDRFARGRDQNPGQDLQQRALSRTVSSHEADGCAAANFKRDSAQPDEWTDRLLLKISLDFPFRIQIGFLQDIRGIKSCLQLSTDP